MIIGSCPYCDHSIWLSIGDRRTPFWGHIECEECGKTFWEEYSRVWPRALTEEEFAKQYEVNLETKEIREKPRPPVDPLVAAIVDKARDELIAESIDRLLYGSHPRIEPLAEGERDKEFLGLRARWDEAIAKEYGVPGLIRGKEANADQ